MLSLPTSERDPHRPRKKRTAAAMKVFLLVLGFLAAALIISQLVMGRMILSSGHRAPWPKAHEHSGYLTVVVVLLYIGLSLSAIVAMPKRERP
jgi:hypothetical protein